MKKISVALLAVGALIVIFMACNFVGLYSFYKSRSASNEPGLKTNKWITVTNLKQPKTGDFIAYNCDTIKRMHRLIATGGDILEIKDGRVYVNKCDFDKNMNLMHAYKLNAEQFASLRQQEVIDPLQVMFDQTYYTIYLEDKVASKHKLSKYKEIAKKAINDAYINRTFKRNWNKDNFGPLIIPKNKVFVMGDNRDYSEDSRYLGFIDTNDIVGVVIN